MQLHPRRGLKNSLTPWSTWHFFQIEAGNQPHATGGINSGIPDKKKGENLKIIFEIFLGGVVVRVVVSLCRSHEANGPLFKTFFLGRLHTHKMH